MTAAKVINRMEQISENRLDLSNITLDQQSLQVLCQQLPNLKITELNVSGTGLTGSTTLAILQSLKGTDVSKLNFSCCFIHDKHMDAILGALKETNVISICFMYCNISDSYAATIPEKLAGTNITEFKLHFRVKGLSQEELLVRCRERLKTISEVAVNSKTLGKINHDVYNEITQYFSGNPSFPMSQYAMYYYNHQKTQNNGAMTPTQNSLNNAISP